MKMLKYFILLLLAASCSYQIDMDRESSYEHAMTLYKSRKYEEALLQLQPVFNEFEDVDSELRVKSLYLRGFIYYLQDKNRLAYQDYLQAIELATDQGDELRVSKLNNEIGQIFYEQELYEQALVYFKSALSMSSKATLQDEAYFNYGVGKTLKELGRLEEAMSYLLQAVDINTEIRSHDALAKTYIKMGQLQADAGNRDLAIEHYLDVIKLASLTQNPNKYLWMANNDAGLAYLLDNELDKAEEFLQKSLEYRNSDSQLWITYNNLGRLYNERGSYKQAWQYFRQSLKYNSNNLELNELAITNNALKKTFTELNQPDSLLYYTMLINDLTLPSMQTKTWLKDEERKIALLTKYQDYLQKKAEKDQYAKTSWLTAFIMTFIFVSGILSMRLWKIYNYKSPKKAHELIKNSGEMVYLLDMFKKEKEEMKKVMDQKFGS